MTTARQLTDTLLERLISPERFGAYVFATGGDRIAAVALYRWNAQISAAFHETLHYVEVIFRNALHRHLEAVHATISGRPSGAAWFDEPSWVTHHWFHDEAAEARNKAVSAAHHSSARPRPGKVVAELPFGFWRYLVTARYQQSFWVPALDAAFPDLAAGTTETRRRHVEHHVAFLHLLRNRIAHHEPIHGTISYRQKGSSRERYGLDDLHSLALELVSWICPEAAGWLAEEGSRVPGLLLRRP